jgi:hypothetical protein
MEQAAGNMALYLHQDKVRWILFFSHFLNEYPRRIGNAEMPAAPIIG